MTRRSHPCSLSLLPPCAPRHCSLARARRADGEAESGHELECEMSRGVICSDEPCTSDLRSTDHPSVSASNLHRRSRSLAPHSNQRAASIHSDSPQLPCDWLRSSRSQSARSRITLRANCASLRCSILHPCVGSIPTHCRQCMRIVDLRFGLLACMHGSMHSLSK
jgi:hypothetical protein